MGVRTPLCTTHLDEAGRCCHEEPTQCLPPPHTKPQPIEGSGTRVPLASTEAPGKAMLPPAPLGFSTPPFLVGEPGALSQAGSPGPQGSQPPGAPGGAGEPHLWEGSRGRGAARTDCRRVGPPQSGWEWEAPIVGAQGGLGQGSAWQQGGQCPGDMALAEVRWGQWGRRQGVCSCGGLAALPSWIHWTLGARSTVPGG